MRATCFLLSGILLFLPVHGFAQRPQDPCKLPEQKQLNFWVGDWDLTWQGKDASEIRHGSNSIRRILGDCVVEENFASQTPPILLGKSVSLFDTTSGKWKQTWVDNEGGYLDFTGDFKDGQMMFWREFTDPKGMKIQQRMVFKNIAANNFDWSWESSNDSGKAWKVIWLIRYQRKVAR